MRSKSSCQLLALFFLLLVSGGWQCQSDTTFPRLPALGADYVSSGNTHGGFIRIFGGFEKGRNLLVAGPMMQLASGKLNAGRVMYYRNISAAPLRARPDAKGRYRYDRVQFGFTAYLQYVHKAPMSPYVRAQEERLVRGSFRAFNEVILSTLESGIGIEGRVNLTRNFSWYYSGGISFHWHTKYHPGISREKIAFTLAITSGLLYVID